MTKSELRYLKKKKEFETRLWLDNLMEDYFISLNINGEVMIAIEDTTTNNNIYYYSQLSTFIYYEYNPKIDKLIIYDYFLRKFTVKFGVSNQRGKSFLKRMFYKHLYNENDK